jgi:beta-lactamase class A
MDSDQINSVLNRLGGQYAFYFHRKTEPPIFLANADRFSSASIIKIPILLAWAFLERNGEIALSELCDLDAEPQVRGAGFAREMHMRRLPYHDVLLMMIATSDNLCTNLVIRKIGLERLNAIFHKELVLPGCELQRKLMDLAARERGADNWISARDCIHLFDLIHELPEAQRAWVEPMLLSCQDTSLLMRNQQRDALHFYHKTGSISGVLHDWGYTRDSQIFLLTNGFSSEAAANQAFGLCGELLR